MAAVTGSDGGWEELWHRARAELLDSAMGSTGGGGLPAEPNSPAAVGLAVAQLAPDSWPAGLLVFDGRANGFVGGPDAIAAIAAGASVARL